MSLNLSDFLNSHKNRLLQVARDSSIPFSYFTARSKDGLFDITIQGTPLVFTVEQNSYDFNQLRYKRSTFAHGFPLSSFSGYTGIDDICTWLGEWLSQVVKRYFEFSAVPDQWSEITSIQPFFASSTFSKADLEMFDEREKKQIQDALLEFQRLLQTETSILKEDLNQIKAKIEYLSSAVNRLNRFDWRGVALSTVIGIATNLSVDTNMGKQIFDLFQRAFSSAINLLPK